MLLLLKAIIMGIVEGITEFLPISSTGHMIIVGHLINFKEPLYAKAYVDMFEVVIQLGAILAIVVLYWDKISKSLRNLKPGAWGFKLWLNIFVAFLPSAVVGLLIHKIIQQKLFGPVPVIAAMIFGGLLLIVIENRYRKKFRIRNIEEVNLGQAFKIGCFQCLSLWPGMSRSASTIMGAWISGLNSVAAAEFSFFLAIPTMVAASGLELVGANYNDITSMQIIALAIGFIVSFIVALLVVEKFVGFLKKKPMRVFAVYRIVMGIILTIMVITKVLQ
jgi:undecaprenyl-diphosphatase